MATIVSGRFVPDTVNDVLDTMIADLEAARGESLPPEDTTIARSLYRPWATQLVRLQNSVGLVLDSAQVDYAEKEALDLLTALIGVPRRQAVAATGSVTFTRETAAAQNYVIPKGIEVQTDGNDPVVFVTSEQVTMNSGTSSVTAPVKAKVAGESGNVAADTVTDIRSSVTGPTAVNNPSPTTGGRDKENDTELRERAKENLSTGSRASASGLVSAMMNIEGVISASIFVNNDSVADAQGLGPHSFELVIEHDGRTGINNDIAQAILDTSAAGAGIGAGNYGIQETGSAELINGQNFVLGYSTPTPVQIYVTVDMEVTDDYEGAQAVQNAIVDYIGGIRATGNSTDGRLSVGSDVIYGTVEYAIRSVNGVYDISSLTVGTSATPTGTANITIADSEKATADATDGSLNITTNLVSPQ
jgi:uncharacterized phage protein gp47/JayE